MHDPNRRDFLLALIGVTQSRGLVLGPPNSVSSFPAIQERQFLAPLVNNQRTVIANFNATSSYFVEDLGSGVSLEMAQIPGGSFNMGSAVPPYLPTDPSPLPIHTVSLPSFSIGTYPITRQQWRQVSTFPRVAMDLH